MNFQMNFTIKLRVRGISAAIEKVGAVGLTRRPRPVLTSGWGIPQTGTCGWRAISREATKTPTPWGSTSGRPSTLDEARGAFLDSASSGSCPGGAQRVSDAHFGKNGKGRAGDECGFITSPPIGGCFTFTMVAVSSCPTARYCRYYRCCWYCCGRLKLSDDHSLRVLLY